MSVGAGAGVGTGSVLLRLAICVVWGGEVKEISRFSSALLILQFIVFDERSPSQTSVLGDFTSSLLCLHILILAFRIPEHGFS